MTTENERKENPGASVVDSSDWFSIRGGWLHLDNRDRIKLSSICRYSCSDYDAFLYFENGDSYSVGTADQSKNPQDIMEALDKFYSENSIISVFLSRLVIHRTRSSLFFAAL